MAPEIRQVTKQVKIVMKKYALMASVVATIFSTNAAALNASFADSAWNGSRIPAGQQCQKFGGDNPSTPMLLISDIPHWRQCNRSGV